MDSMYLSLPGDARGSILEKVLRDLFDLNQKGFEKQTKCGIVPSTDPCKAKIEVWGKTDSFEDLVEALIGKYEEEAKSILGDDEVQEIDPVSLKRISEVTCKQELARSLFRANIDWRVSQSLEHKEKRLAVLSFQGDIFLVRPMGADTMEEGGTRQEVEKNENQNWMSYIG